MNYHWIGHYKDGNSDKIWGMIRLTDNGRWPESASQDYVSFWGRRGKKLQTKIYRNIWSSDADKMCDKKLDDGYISVTNLDEVYPDFEQDLEKTTVWALLVA
jgi:hypothetical protein